MVILCPNPSLPKSFKYIVRRCFGPPKGFLRRSFGVQTPILKSGFQVPRPEGETRGSPEEMAGQGWYCFSNLFFLFSKKCCGQWVHFPLFSHSIHVWYIQLFEWLIFMVSLYRYVNIPYMAGIEMSSNQNQ